MPSIRGLSMSISFAVSGLRRVQQARLFGLGLLALGSAPCGACLTLNEFRRRGLHRLSKKKR